jgi:hypothetical protein
MQTILQHYRRFVKQTRILPNNTWRRQDLFWPIVLSAHHRAESLARY